MLVSLSFFVITPILLTGNLDLPMPVSLPYSVENSVIFWTTYLYQATTAFIVCSVHVAVDSTFSGLLLLIKRHQEILKFRLQNLTTFSNGSEFKSRHRKLNAEHSIKQIIKDHERIYRYIYI